MEYIGSLLLAYCSLPLFIKAWKYGSVEIDPTFYYLWLIGEMLLLVSYWRDPALLLNYGTNTAVLLYIWGKRT